MTIIQLQGWIVVTQMLIGLGINVMDALKHIINTAHPEMTPEEIDAAYSIIIADDRVRAAFAAAAAKS